MDGYEEARKIDDQINQLLEQCEMKTLPQIMEWLKLAKTLQTTSWALQERARTAMQHLSDRDTERV